MTALNMDVLADMVAAHGIPARVEQSGGGCATLYVGNIDADGRCLVVAGPGWFEGPDWSDPRATWDEFSWGPDDDGEGDHRCEPRRRALADLAADIAALARNIQEQQ